jgi:hypothetical protein
MSKQWFVAIAGLMSLGLDFPAYAGLNCSPCEIVAGRPPHCLRRNPAPAGCPGHDAPKPNLTAAQQVETTAWATFNEAVHDYKNGKAEQGMAERQLEVDQRGMDNCKALCQDWHHRITSDNQKIDSAKHKQDSAYDKAKKAADDIAKARKDEEAEGSKPVKTEATPNANATLCKYPGSDGCVGGGPRPPPR